MKGTGKKVATSGNGTVSATKMRKVALSSMGMSSYGMGGAGEMSGTGTNFYSPYLSTDFLELPQSKRERLERERFWYRTHPYIGQAVDLHTELPLSKLRLSKPPLPDGAEIPEATTKQASVLQTTTQRAFESAGIPRGTASQFANRIGSSVIPDEYRDIIDSSYRFFKKMCDRLNLFQVLIDMSFEYNLHDEVWIWVEDGEVPTPPEEESSKWDTEQVGSITKSGKTVTGTRLTRKGKKQKLAYDRKAYRGWSRMFILPPENIIEKVFSFSQKQMVELVPPEETKEVIMRAETGDPEALEAVQDIPDDVLECISAGKNIPLGTDPTKGSFVFQVYRRKHQYRAGVIPRMDRLERSLTYQDKLRQAQTSIASRAMTPKRLVWAEDLDERDVEALRDQVDLALTDPDFSIVTNYEVHWEDIGAKDRLLDLDREYDRTDKDIFAGYGVTESMLTGEGAYGQDRVNLEVINTRYLLFRERLQYFVEKMLFEPIAVRKGFTIKDVDGDDIPIYPRLSFTRLAIRDNQDTFDSFLNLYQKGSLPVKFILELLNIDPDAALEQLESDVLTLNDSQFNEFFRAIYPEIGRNLAEKSDAADKVAAYLGLTLKPPTDDRFGAGK
jgi:hypothetical protein